MKVLLTGSSGLIGTELQNFLRICGHTVACLVRKRNELFDDAIFWDPVQGKIDVGSLEGFDAIVHLAGENIAAGRWTKARKQRILDSRIRSTETLVTALCQLKNPPKTFICASAIGFYGDRGDALCNEHTSGGSGFLADVCRKWEAATLPAAEKGIRTINLRTGIVLSPKGGALGKMLIPFKLWLGGKLGSGKQYMSWIALDDLVAIVLFILTQNFLKGPVNAVSPHPVTNAEFTKTLGKILNRPTFFSMPAFALRLILGTEMADEFLLGSTRVEPLKLEEAGYSFSYPNLEHALIHLLT